MATTNWVRLDAGGWCGCDGVAVCHRQELFCIDTDILLGHSVITSITKPQEGNKLKKQGFFFHYWAEGLGALQSANCI